jgi:hypothetical protein
MMFVVLVNRKKLPPLIDMMPELIKKFPHEKFSIHGSEDKDYHLQIDGDGDERLPRKFAESFLKTWKPTLA